MSKERDKFVSKQLSKMTLEEKVGQVLTFTWRGTMFTPSGILVHHFRLLIKVASLFCWIHVVLIKEAMTVVELGKAWPCPLMIIKSISLNGRFRLKIVSIIFSFLCTTQRLGPSRIVHGGKMFIHC